VIGRLTDDANFMGVLGRFPSDYHGILHVESAGVKRPEAHIGLWPDLRSVMYALRS
jgi:hypothetical protein